MNLSESQKKQVHHMIESLSKAISSFNSAVSADEVLQTHVNNLEKSFGQLSACAQKLADMGVMSLTNVDAIKKSHLRKDVEVQ